MTAKPLSKGAADAIRDLILNTARGHKAASTSLPSSVDPRTYMEVATAEIAATLFGAVCGVDAELQLRRVLCKETSSHAFGPALRADAESIAAKARRVRTPSLPRPSRRFIDLTHPQD